MNDKTTQFDNMTIGELRKLTEDYQRLQRQNLILKTKYPMAKLEDNDNIDLDQLIKDL